MEYVSVDETQWTVSAIAQFTREQFVSTFMADADMYPKHDEARKLVALNAVYDQCVPAPAEETKPKGKKGKPEPLDEE